MGSIQWVSVERSRDLAFITDIRHASLTQLFGDGYIWNSGFMYCRVLGTAAFQHACQPMIMSTWVYVAQADAADLAQPVPGAWWSQPITAFPGYQFYAPVFDDTGRNRIQDVTANEPR